MLLAAVVLTLFVAGCASAPQPSPLDRYLKSAEAFGFDGQVLVERDGRVLVQRAFGLADREQERRMTLDTAFGIASQSKQFTAAAILALEAEGRLKVEDSIGAHLAGVPADKQTITIHQLLTHTSGLPRGDIVADFADITPAQLVAKILAAPLEGAGTWRYSNAGYNLLAAIVERESGMSLAAYMRKRLFDRAGMTRTGVIGVDAPGHSAVAYRGLAPQDSIAGWRRNWRTWGGGDVFSTVSDLHRWERALRSGRILPPAQLEKFYAPHVKIEGDEAYGYGWFVTNTARGRRIEHGGDTELGYHCLYRVYPDSNTILLLLGNRTEVGGVWQRWGLQDAIEKAAFGEAFDALPSVRPAARVLGEGKWSATSGAEVEIRHDGDQLVAIARNQAAAALLWNGSRTEAATSKIERLLVRIHAGEIRPAYEEVLAPDGLQFVNDYVREWSDLTARHGPLVSWRVVGSIPGRRGSARTFAWLQFERGTVGMTWNTRDLGAGRVIGSAPGEAPPLGRVLALRSDGMLVGRDLVSGSTVEIAPASLTN